MRYLLVDDNKPFLEASRTLLSREGLEVVGTATPIPASQPPPTGLFPIGQLSVPSISMLFAIVVDALVA